MKLLIDECLSPELAERARARGFPESTHINWRGLSGAKDWDLLPLIVEEDWTFVTCNSVDFRGSASRPGARGQYKRTDIHAGLVCLNGPPEGLDLDLQHELMDLALDELATLPDLINQVLEVTLETEDGDAIVTRYPMPA
jgi:hypothetical protein